MHSPRSGWPPANETVDGIRAGDIGRQYVCAFAMGHTPMHASDVAAHESESYQRSSVLLSSTPAFAASPLPLPALASLATTGAPSN
jgi:hypothetical protein